MRAVLNPRNWIARALPSGAGNDVDISVDKWSLAPRDTVDSVNFLMVLEQGEREPSVGCRFNERKIHRPE